MTLTKATDINALILYKKKNTIKKEKSNSLMILNAMKKKKNSEKFKKCPAISQTAQS